MATNRLRETASPYLHQHADNPVQWQPWDDAAFALARQLDKPVLLSIGYAACHWCHVMAHESFENAETAALMNELFVNIKVDREERPDIDAIYMNALHLLGIPGGWPLTMFLAPDGRPFWGGTYFPDEPRYGQPSFRQVLTAVHRTYRESPDTIDKNTAALTQGLAQMAESAGGVDVSPALLGQIAERLLEHIDLTAGGLSGAPKFPQAQLLELLWREGRRSGNPDMRRAVTTTLDHMSQGGIYDHLGGGFSRYSVDARWLVPHFEKMLYDNAALIELLTLVWAETKSPLYAARVAETVGWLAREMTTESGAFSASLDADSEGVEGKFYVWSADEVRDILGTDEARLFCSVYDVSDAGNFEHANILNRLGSIALKDEPTETRLAAAREKLLIRRNGRVRPGLDDKVLADWNGLMIAALVRAGRNFGVSEWIDAARAAFEGVVETLDQGNGRLHHAWRGGHTQPNAIADDYANMIRAALLLLETNGDARDLERARAWTATLDAHYWDSARGGYCQTADDADPLITRSRSASDTPLPNANGVMIEVHTRLYHLTGDARHRERADDLVAAFSGEVTRNFSGLGAFLNGAGFAMQAPQIVMLGSREAPQMQGLLGEAFAAPLPALMVQVVEPGQELPRGHPAAGKTMTDGRPTAYVCVGTTCSLPVTEPSELRALLAQ